MTDDETRSHNRISKLGYVVLVMAMVSLCVVLLTSYQDRQDTECQKALNAEFLSVLKERAVIADGDRQAVRDLVQGLVDAKTEEESAQALEEYKNDNAELDKLRADVEYPSANSCK